MDFSRLNYPRLAVGLTSAALLVIAVLFLPWFSYDLDGVQKDASEDSWICGVDETECTAFDTFPILRWLLLLAALAPIILAYILVRAHKLSYPPGEMTMIAGFAAAVLIAYNGIIDKPGTGPAESGLGLDYGYWVAIVASIGIAATGFLRSQAGQKRERKAPGTV